MLYEYKPKGVCSRLFRFDIADDKIVSLKVEGGCDGNLKGISRIIVGMNIDDVISAFDGVDCHGKGTSCPDQIARALKSFRAAE